MQSLDSSCQEADTIINDALLKLKGSSLQSNSQNSFRQQALLQSSPYPQYQQLSQQQHSTQQPQHSYFRQSLRGLHPLPSAQPPPYLFDGPDSPPDYATLGVSQLGENVLLSSTSSGGGVQNTCQPISSLSTPSLLSNINSIISPPSVVPDMLLNTSPTSPSLHCLKPEKRTLLSPAGSSDNVHVNNLLGNSLSPSKKPKLTNSSMHGEGISSSTSPLPTVQTLLSSSSSMNNNNSNAKITSASVPSFSAPHLDNQCQLVQQNFPVANTKSNFDQFKLSKVVYSTSISSNALNNPIITGSSSCAPLQRNSYPPLSVSGSPSAMSSQQHTHGGNALALSTSSIVTPVATCSNLNRHRTAYFDIHGKIRELYLYLLIQDEKGLKESRKRHRSRSFVLERLVEREKLNTIVLNLYPGNKGYSLALYQDGSQHEALNDSSTNYKNTSDCISVSSISSDGGCGNGATGSTTTFEGGGAGGSGTNGGSSSRLKQPQISNNSLNNRNNNNFLSSKHDVDFDMTLGSVGGGNLKSKIIFDSCNVNATNAAAADDSLVAQQIDYNIDKDDDENLMEVMSWPYDVDDLLNSIDKEELPMFICDLLETRIPNVFYSGCVICQVRDYRQTPIASNSCDIYHVLLKPTNEMLYADINQISIESHISNDEKLILESQLVLATAEPLCLDPDPRIGRYAINSQHRKQMWNTTPLRRQMKKFSQLSINRKRKIDQFTHHYGQELCDYLQRLRQRPRQLPGIISDGSGGSRLTGSSSAAALMKLQKKPNGIIRPLRPPNLDYPPLADPGSIDVLSLAKAYPPNNQETRLAPVLVEEWTLESDHKSGHIYFIKLSIYQRPATTEYLGELYVDRIYQQGGATKGESCRFSLGTRAYASRYIEQFKDIFTEEGRKSVRIIHTIPGQPPKITNTTGYQPVNYQDQQKLHQSQQQQMEINSTPPTQTQHLAMQQHQQQQQLQQQIQSAGTSQQLQQQIQQSFQTNQIITPTLNATNASQLAANQQLNINMQAGNILGITATNTNQQIRQNAQQIFDASGNTMNIQTQPGQHISLSNGSLVLVQQQPSGPVMQAGISVQNATNNQQKSQLATNNNQMGVSSSRAQLGSNVPLLQAQLKAAPVVTGQQQQTIIQKMPNVNVNQSNNSNANTYVTGFMNVSNSLQQQQQSQVQIQQHPPQSKSASNASILSLLNSAPAAMTSTPISSTFNAAAVQGQSIVQQQQHQSISAEQLLQQPPRKTNEVIQSLLSNNLRKINVGNNGSQTVSGQTRNTNLITVGLPSDATASQNVRVTMSALASQLASPALMTNSNFGYTAASASNNNSNLSLSNNNIKILNNTAQRIINASALRRDSLATAAPSPGSDSNASNTSGTSNLGFAMPGLNALLTTSPSSSSDQSQIASHANIGGGGTIPSIGNVSTNLTSQALFERLNNNSSTNINNSGLSPQQTANITKNIMQHVGNVQSPVSSISPLSSPPPQPSPQQAQVQQAAQTTTLNLQGINLQSLQGAMATFPGLQNVQVQIPGLPRTISLSLPNTQMGTGSGSVCGNSQGAGQQATSLLVSVPVTSTTQVNTMQKVPGGCGTVVSAVPVSGAATQTVVLTSAGNAGNAQAGSMLSLPIAQLVASGVKGLNPQTLRTATVSGGPSNNVINANIIQTSNGSGNVNNTTGSPMQGTVNMNNSTRATSIQLLGTLQQRPHSIQVVGTKPITNRGQLTQRNISNSGLKLTTGSPGPTQIATTANLTATPLVMTTQKLQLKLQKPSSMNLQQQQVQPSHHSQQQLANQQQAQQIQLGGATLTQNLTAAAMVAAANQKRRRSATDVNK